MNSPLDFEALLGLANQTHSKSTKDSSKFISLKVQANKKPPKDPKLSEGVKKFKERQAKAEIEKRREAAQKRSNLLELRQGNKKSARAANSMLQRTKSSNKAAIAEARNDRDTADTLAGRMQCDEDDYGYESAVGGAFYEKLMAKYESNPGEDPMSKFSKSAPKRKKDVAATLARVKGALELGGDDEIMTTAKANKRAREEEERRKREKEAKEEERRREEESRKSRREKEAEEARKKRLKLAKQAPPPMSFEELTKMAQKKHKEPVKMESFKIKKKAEAEFDRPMTKKEKEEFMRERESQMRKSGKIPKKPSTEQPIKSSSGRQPSSSATSHSQGSASGEKVDKAVKKSPSPPPSPKKPVITGPEFHPAVLKAKKKEEEKKANLSRPSTSGSSRKTAESRKVDDRARKRPRSPSRSPSPVRGGGGGARNSSRVIDSDEYDDEEDSDMDDFIDDSDAKMDISAQIRNIFGYDRRKFRDEGDFDDRSMECNRFSEVMKEEARSARIGMQEDLEDIRREEEEKKRKRMMKAKKRR